MKEVKKKPGPGAHSPEKVIQHHKVNPPVFSFYLYAVFYFLELEKTTNVL